MRLVHWVCCLLIAVACKKTVPPVEETFSARRGNGFYILNEGNFQWSNASVSYADRTRDTVWHDVYAEVNQMPLGDVLQSGIIAGDKAYWVVNNSGKIVVTDAATLSVTSEITGFSSPRHMVWVNDTLALVTDLYANRIAVVNPSTSSISRSIPLKGWTEQMVQANGVVWVTNRSADFLAVVDPFTSSITDSVAVTFGSHAIAIDAEEMIWVLCSGKTGVAAAVHRIHPSTFTIMNTFQLPTPAPTKMCIDATGRSVYLASSSAIYRLDITDNSFPVSPLTAMSLTSLYGLSADRYDGIWITDAGDYISAGKLYHIDGKGMPQDTLSGGLLPNGVLFW